MSGGVNASQPTPSDERRARLLIGWLDSSAAFNLLSPRAKSDTSLAALDSQVQAARSVVQTRPIYAITPQAVQPLPDELNTHISSLPLPPGQGMSFQLVELRQIIAIQPSVFADHANERVAAASQDDMESLARITLPLPAAVDIHNRYDPDAKSWMIWSRNLNLAVTSQYVNLNDPNYPGQILFGFAVTVIHSLMSVLHYQGRYFLFDGSHRAYGFANRGIFRVPALVKEVSELPLVPNILPQAVLLNERPPLVTDYLSDEVAMEAYLPATQRLIIIQALQLQANIARD